MSIGELRFELDSSKPNPARVGELLLEAREARRLEGLGDSGDEALANELIGCGCKHSPLTLALSKGSLSVTKVLLAHGADPNLRNADGKVPLAIAIRKRDQASLKLLIDSGADIRAVVNKTAWTAWVVILFSSAASHTITRQFTLSFPSICEGYTLLLPRVSFKVARF